MNAMAVRAGWAEHSEAQLHVFKVLSLSAPAYFSGFSILQT